MTKRIDSDALGILTKALGLSGAGSPVTELADGVVDQTLDIVPIVRRSRTAATSEGIFIGLLQNDHSGSGTLTTSVFPYSVSVGSIPPYPSPMPPQFDIWILSATLLRESGTSTVNCALQTITPARFLGFGVDDGGAAVTATILQVHAFWNALQGLSTNFGTLQELGAQAKPGFRLPRDPATELRFVSSASAAGKFNCFVTLGIFPVALGQDVLV